MRHHLSQQRQASPTALLARWFDSGRPARPTRRFRPSIDQEVLEDRVVMSTTSITVNTLQDGTSLPGGLISLREAINFANQASTNVIINFASSLASRFGPVGQGAFSPLTPLPDPGQHERPHDHYRRPGQLRRRARDDDRVVADQLSRVQHRDRTLRRQWRQRHDRQRVYHEQLRPRPREQWHPEPQ